MRPPQLGRVLAPGPPPRRTFRSFQRVGFAPGPRPTGSEFSAAALRICRLVPIRRGGCTGASGATSAASTTELFPPLPPAPLAIPTAEFTAPRVASPIPPSRHRRITSGCSGLRAALCYTTFTICARPAAAEPQVRYAPAVTWSSARSWPAASPVLSLVPARGVRAWTTSDSFGIQRGGAANLPPRPDPARRLHRRESHTSAASNSELFPPLPPAPLTIPTTEVTAPRVASPIPPSRHRRITSGCSGLRAALCYTTFTISRARSR